jgi:hypothetical protein
VSSHDECEYAPDSDCDRTVNQMTKTIHSDWSVHGDERQCDGSEESTDCYEFEVNVKQSSVQWVLEQYIPRCHVSNLLKRLHSDAKLINLPIDS